MNITIRTGLTISMLTLTLGAATASAQHQAMSAGMTHAEHQAQMKQDAELKQRGAGTMGFDQDAAVHHFLLDRTGGAIDVAASDPASGETRDAIRSHLKEIASEFALGVFDKPLAIHDDVPPGTSTMQARREAISYQYQETPAGARVRISSRDGRAIEAIHAFLRYQILEHATGDPLVVP